MMSLHGSRRKTGLKKWRRVCIWLYGAIAREWDEDWISGRRYMEIEPLWIWEKENTPKEKELALLPSDTSLNVRKLIVA